jgi:serine phosphatase RsbU (regulator of sigma subunit)
VPGAFMSMLGVSFLSEIVNKTKIEEPGVILNHLRSEVIRTLKQKGVSGEQKDGMDLSFIRLRTDKLELEYAGANNSLYIVSRTEPLVLSGDTKIKSLQLEEGDEWALYEVKPDKMPIAIYDKMDAFRTHRLRLNKGDKIYMFSDGFVDQFGGPKGKKFKSKPFKRLLLKHASLKMEEQKLILDQSIMAWMQGYHQVDDITLMGLEV